MKKGLFVLTVIAFAVFLSSCAGNKAANTDVEKGVIDTTPIPTPTPTQTLEMNNNTENEEKILAFVTDTQKTLLLWQREKLSKPEDQIYLIDLHYIINDMQKIVNEIDSLTIEDGSWLTDFVHDIKIENLMDRKVIDEQFRHDFVKSETTARDHDSDDRRNDTNKMQKSLTLYVLDKYIDRILGMKIPEHKKE